MKINGFKINGFGKLKDKQVELSDGINIIYGENESGKSSMLKFISGMLYGTSKNKNGKDISDFDKYKPWKTEEFSGKINYTLDDGQSFEVYREFKKKNPVIYNFMKEDISKSFKADKTKGIDFFTEQTGIDEETFYNTAISEQEGIRLSKSSQNSITQKISNLISSGDDSISFKRSLEKIKDKQNTEVGSERTSQRPINIVDTKIRRLIEEKKILETYKEGIIDYSVERESLRQEIRQEEAKKELLKEIKLKQDNNRIKSAEINFNKNLEDQYTQKIEELNKKIVDNDVEKKYEKINLKNYYISIVVLVIIFAILMIIRPHFINVLVLLPIIPIVSKISKEKDKARSAEHTRNYSTNKIVNEIDILKQNRENQKVEAEEKTQRLADEMKKDKQELVSKYLGAVDSVYIDEFLNKSYEDVMREIDFKESRISATKFRLQTLEGRTREINNKIEDLSKIEEELEDAETEKEELVSLNNSFNIARECLEKAYSQVRENISPKFTQNLCEIISKISDNRYSNVILNDSDGLSVEIENGSYIPASRLSVGTIDQMYLSLRLSALKEISDETMPIILDEAFAYFDDDRLTNILKYIKTNFVNNQIIIFTCSKREKEILDKLNIYYNLISLEK